MIRTPKAPRDQQEILRYVARIFMVEGQAPTIQDVSTHFGWDIKRVRKDWTSLYRQGILGPMREDPGAILPLPTLLRYEFPHVTVLGNCSHEDALALAQHYLDSL